MHKLVAKALSDSALAAGGDSAKLGIEPSINTTQHLGPERAPLSLDLDSSAPSAALSSALKDEAEEPNTHVVNNASKRALASASVFAALGVTSAALVAQHMGVLAGTLSAVYLAGCGVAGHLWLGQQQHFSDEDFGGQSEQPPSPSSALGQSSDAYRRLAQASGTAILLFLNVAIVVPLAALLALPIALGIGIGYALPIVSKLAPSLMARQQSASDMMSSD